MENFSELSSQENDDIFDIFYPCHLCNYAYSLFQDKNGIQHNFSTSQNVFYYTGLNLPEKKIKNILQAFPKKTV